MSWMGLSGEDENIGLTAGIENSKIFFGEAIIIEHEEQSILMNPLLPT